MNHFTPTGKLTNMLMRGRSQPGLTLLEADKIILHAAQSSTAIVRSLNLSEISMDSDVILCPESTAEVVEKLRKKVRQGSKLSPILILETPDKQLRVIDDGNSLAAYELENVAEADAVFVHGDDAMALRLRIMAQVGRFNFEQKRSAAILLLKMDGGWEQADSVIGNRCGLAEWIIADLREHLIATDPQFANAQIPYHPHVIRGDCSIRKARSASASNRATRKRPTKPRPKRKLRVASKLRKLVKKVGIFRARQINAALRKFGLNATRGTVYVLWTEDMPYPHIIFCGDCTDPAFYEIAFKDHKVGEVNADLPYNVDYVAGRMKKGYVSPANKIRNDNLSRKGYRSFVTSVIATLAPFLYQGAPFFVWSGQDESETVKDILQTHLGKRRDDIIWLKKGLRQSRHYFKRGYEKALWGWTKGPKLRCWRGGNSTIDVIVEAELDQSERERGVEPSWKYRLPRSIHPCPKPVGVIRRMIELVLEPGGIVLDPVMGSGTTVLAAHLEGRVGVGIELRPEYVGVAIDRFRTHCRNVQIARIQLADLANFLLWLEADYARRHP